MALVKCPDCGKMVSSRASACPACGCPIEYIAVESKQETEKEYISFHIAHRTISYPVGNEKFASVLGDFLQLGYSAREELRHAYFNCKDIETALEKVPEVAMEMLNMVINKAIEIMFRFGINFTAEDFVAKYYYQHNIDYNQFYTPVVEAFAEITNMKAELDQYREFEKAGRSHWEGGGFSVKGAIKGAITARLMNAGKDFLYSFGDNAKLKKDNILYRNALDQLYHDSKTLYSLCDSISVCIMNVFLALKEEMIEIGSVDAEGFSFEKKDADILYNNTENYVEKGSQEYIDNLIKCIYLYPAERKYYEGIEEAIFDDVWEHIGEDDPQNFYGFLAYWGIGFYYPQDEIEGSEVVEETEKIREEAEKAESEKIQGPLDKWMYDRGYRDQDYENVTVEDMINIELDVLDYLNEGIDDLLDRSNAYAKISNIHVDYCDYRLYQLAPYSVPITDYIDTVVGVFNKIRKYIFYSFGTVGNEFETGVDPNKILGQQLGSDDAVELYFDASRWKNAKCGFAITRKCIIDLQTRKKFAFSEIQEIVLDESDEKYEDTIRISDGIKSANIKVYNESRIEGISGHYEKLYFITFLKLICFRYGNNPFFDGYDTTYEDLRRQQQEAIKYRQERKFMPEQKALFGAELFVEKMKETILMAGIDDVFEFTPVDQMSEQEKFSLTKTMRKKNPGNVLFFNKKISDDEIVILTDIYILTWTGVVPLRNVEKLEWFEEGATGRDYSEILVKLKNEDFVIPLKGMSEIEGRTFAGAVNIALGVKESEQEWQKILLANDFDKGWEKENLDQITLNSDEGNYVRIRKYLYKFYRDKNVKEIPEYSSYCLKLQNYFDKLEHFFRMLSHYEIIEWIPVEIDKEEFFNCLREDRNFLRKSYLKCIWIHGDGKRGKWAPSGDIAKRFNEKLYIYRDLSFLENGKSGFALTENYFVDLKTLLRIHISDVKDISVYDDSSIRISDGTNIIKIKSSELDDAYALLHLAHVFCLYCLRYGHNNNVWSEKMSIPKPSEPEMDTLKEMVAETQNEAADVAPGQPKSDTIFCTNCGQKIARTAKFCNYCGQRNTYGIGDN